MNMSDALKELRKKRGLTQKELAEKAGLSIATIQGYEQGKYKPKGNNLIKFADVLYAPVYELLGLKYNPDTDEDNKVYDFSLSYIKNDIEDQKRYYLTDRKHEQLLEKLNNYVSVGNSITDIAERHESFDCAEELIGEELINNLLTAHPFEGYYDIALFLSYYFSLTNSMRDYIKDIVVALYGNKELLNIHFKEYPQLP